MSKNKITCGKKRDVLDKRRKKFSKKRKSPVRKAVGAVIVLLVILALWWNFSLKPASGSEQKAEFVIEEGMTATQVAAELSNKKIIRSETAFRLLARLHKADSKLGAGLYYLSPDMSSQEILDTLIQGSVPEAVKVTIPEGFTVAQIVQTLTDNGLGSKKEYERAMSSFSSNTYDFLKDIPDGDNRLEGFLFPDTYFFDKNSKPEDIINRFLVRFEEELDKETKARLKELDLSVYEWVIKASIVEREAAIQEERPIIAGVFENRLRIGMPLQSCATVQYILGEVKPVLSLDDIAIDSPYNTYKYTGLPPGPIASPGHASLNAVLYPDKTDYLYFVAKNDGSHAFAVTYDEHLKNVNRYE